MPHENLYNLTLAQQTETAHRLLNDVELQYTGAIALKDGRLEVTGEQLSDAHTEMKGRLASRPQPASTSQAELSTLSAEADIAVSEKLSGIVARSGITVNSYMSNEVVTGIGYGWRHLRSETMAPGDEARFDKNLTLEIPLVELNKQGVSEVITFSGIADTDLLDNVPGHQGEKGDVVCVTYETTDAASGLLSGMPYAYRVKYPGKARRYPTGFEKGAPGASFSYHLFMTPEDANNLRTVIIEKPEAVHLLNETMMIEAFGADAEGFRKRGPQYDAWREADGGQAKLAIRDSFEAPATESQIIPYN